MFYSHEILTSPEHGVATIWLVATLGSRSIARKLNRKTILDVDVPKACDVIVNPEAPMALRLQGSLLYGVSRVYNQQCGYTLMDVQTMHDRMRPILKVIHGAAIDPSAGKAKPDQLILPYDPSFLPEVNLPGLDFDLSKFDFQPEIPTSQGSSLLWAKSPEPSQLSQPSLQLDDNLQLDIPSDGLFHFGGFGSETDVSGSVHRRGNLARTLGLEFGVEEGVLLQPDFEFDEDGNLIELEGRPTDEDRNTDRVAETPLRGDIRVNDGLDLDLDYQPMPMDEEIEAAAMAGEEARNPEGDKPKSKSSHSEVIDEEDNSSDREVRMGLTRKNVKAMVADSHIGLRNKDLAQWNNEYLQNMAAASKQKQQNKLPTFAKHNAAFWVFGQGIGSVGAGLGTARASHPLKHFSGDDLYDSLTGSAGAKGRKRGRLHNSEPETEGRRVCARLDEEQAGHDGLPGEVIMQDDPEVGRHAPSSVHDDHSSQMPWNVTASVQSSRHGSSAAQVFRGFGSAGDLSSRGPESAGIRPQDAMMQLAGLGRSRSRLTSASPLAGRGFPFDMENLENLGNEGELEDVDLDLYLQNELDMDRRTVSAEGPEAVPMRYAAPTGNFASMQKNIRTSNLDQESLNFLEFLNTKTESLAAGAVGDHGRDAEGEERSDDMPHLRVTGSSGIAFSSLLSPQKTSRAVATNALMHVLTLATKGFLTVRQEPYIDETTEEYGAKYRYGEILMHLPEM